MKDREESREELLAELLTARRRIAELEAIELLHSRLQDDLQRSEDKYRSLVDSTEDSIYVIDRECRYVFMNRKHLSRLGLSVDGYRGRSYGEFHSPEEARDFTKKVAAVVRTGESQQHEHAASRDGHYFLRTLSPVRDAQGAVTAVTVVSKDITTRKKMEEELRALTLSDELTGLYNRRGFFTLAKQQLRISQRLKRHALLFSIDMDALKVINDTLGHPAGDRALTEAADIIKKNFRESDVIGRIGGDEFAVFMIEHTDIDSGLLARRLHDILNIYNSQGRRPYTISLSIGVARYDPWRPSSLDALLEQADKMMYQQKRNKQG